MNTADNASDGHVWALDSYLPHVQVWKIGQMHSCIRIEYDGTWTSFAGVSPGGTGTISAGLTGTFHGMRIFRLTGAFNPEYPLSGHVADFDSQSGADGTCTGPRPTRCWTPSARACGTRPARADPAYAWPSRASRPDPACCPGPGDATLRPSSR